MSGTSSADVLEAIPPEKRLISWRGAAASASELSVAVPPALVGSRRDRISWLSTPGAQRMGWRRCCSSDRRGAAT